MFKFSLLAVAGALIASPLAAQATVDAAAAPAPTTVPVVKPEAMLVSADGRRVGRIDNVRGGTANVIHNGRFVSVPVSTLSADGGHLVTSLKLADLTRR